jgi:hypothetical protein
LDVAPVLTDMTTEATDPADCKFAPERKPKEVLVACILVAFEGKIAAVHI